MGKEQIISMIRKYATERLMRPSRHTPLTIFASRSYMKWAIMEILKRVEETEEIFPILVIEKFAEEMDDFSCRNHEESIIFSIAHDVAEDVIDFLITMEDEYERRRRDESSKKGEV